MKYERLTERDENGIATYKDKCDADSFEENLYIHAKREEAVVNRLAELEDKIENGTLIELEKLFIRQYESIPKQDKYFICKAQLVYLSNSMPKAEAEKKLKELRGKDETNEQLACKRQI